MLLPALLEPFFLLENEQDNHDDITKIIDGYVKLGFKLDSAKLIELSSKEPKIIIALKSSLDFWNMIGLMTLDPTKSKELTEPFSRKFSISLSVLLYISKILQEPLLERLAKFSLIYNLQCLTNQISNQVANNYDELDGIIKIIQLLSEDAIFIDLKENLVITSDVKILLAEYAKNIALDLQNHLSKLHNSTNNLLLLHLVSMLSMRVQDLNIIVYGDSDQTAIENWQSITEGFIKLQNIARRAIKPKVVVNQQEIVKRSNQEVGYAAIIPDPILLIDEAGEQATEQTVEQELFSPEDELRAARKNLINLLNDHNYWQAANNLQDLLTDIERLDLIIENLSLKKHTSVVLPKLIIKEPVLNLELTKDLDLIEFKVISTHNSRVKVIVTCNNQKVSYFPWHTEIHQAAMPRRIKIPGFKGELLINKDGSLTVKQLPKEYNYNFIVERNLYIDKLIIKGRIKAVVKGKIVNLNVCAAHGGVLFFAQEVDNKNGIITTFNLGIDEQKKLCKKLALHRFLTTLLAREDSQSINTKYKEHLQTKFNKIQIWLKKNFQDLNSGKIYIQTISALDNYNGSILSGNSCGLTGRVDNRHGVIASHHEQVEIFSLEENSSIICSNYGTIWAKTALQMQAPKIIKDSTSYIEGLEVTNLRSFKGSLRYEGPTVGAD